MPVKAKNLTFSCVSAFKTMGCVTWAFLYFSFGAAFYSWHMSWTAATLERNQGEQIHRPLQISCWAKSNSEHNCQ